ncbi:MAG TPA: serine hydrolase, partial [Verrucomicrobiae bacterium]
MKLSLSAPLRLCAFALIFAIGCVHGPKQQRSSSQTAGFYSQKLAAIDEAIASAISSNKLPGGVLWIEHDNRSYHRAYGKRSVDPVEAMTEDTIFDAASLTKVVATTSAIMRLYERGQIDLEAPVSKYLPEFNWPKQQPITVRQLLTHVSGLRPDVSLTESWSGYNTGIHLALEEQPTTTPGTAFRYSDINFILLGEIVHRVSGKPLNEFTAHEIFEPLGMTHTGFLPKNPALVAPTTRETNGFVRGIVHDPTARRMDGVAGHAGLFITASDLARFARMMLNGGELEGKRIFKPETVALFTSVQSPANLPRRGLGWDIDSPYAGPRGKYFPVGSYGHTGWTGGSLWIDPFSKSFVIFMSNRNHPTEAGNVVPLRYLIGTLAAEAIPDFNFVYVPDALEKRPERPTVTSRAVLNGIDVLKREEFASLKGLRIGLITNHTGHDRERNPTI